VTPYVGGAGAASELTLDLEALKAKIADLRRSVQVPLPFICVEWGSHLWYMRPQLVPLIRHFSGKYCVVKDSNPNGQSLFLKVPEGKGVVLNGRESQVWPAAWGVGRDSLRPWTLAWICVCRCSSPPDSPDVWAPGFARLNRIERLPLAPVA
jgi:hypothetical protein